MLVAALLLLTGCTGALIGNPTAQDPASRGGTLTLLSAQAVPSLDPQRITDPTIAAMAGRTLHRTLTAYAPLADGATQGRLVGDLATDTGTASDDLRTWRFTLRDGVRWQDGTPVRCADVKRAVARAFATAEVPGGVSDAVAVLAVPRSPDGRSSYLGPYAAGPENDAGREAFDRAVSCDGATITFLLSEPTSDFNEMVTSTSFAPVPEATDTDAAAAEAAFSSGPYRLQSTWDPGTGGILVRNEHWDPDADPVRRALPDRIRWATALQGAAIVESVLADREDTRAALSLVPVPPAVQQQVEAVPALRARSAIAPTGVVDYLVPSMRSALLGNKDVRRALALATNRAGYAVGLATASAVRPHVSVVPTALFAAATTGAPVPAADPEAARELLVAAGVSLPVPIRVAYRPGPAAERGMAALVTGWRAAGFEPTLVPIADDYFTTIAAPGAAESHDVFWSNWAPAWGSASTVLPTLFDSSLNLTESGTGRDYGAWSNADWNATSTSIAAIADRTEREQAWARADEALREDVAYIGLVERSALLLAGSDVRGLVAQPHGGGALDLAVAGVAR